MATNEDGDVRVWQRPDGSLVIRDENENYGADVLWLDDMDQPPADAVPLAAHLPSVVPGDTANEGGDVRDRGREKVERELQQSSAGWPSGVAGEVVSALAAAGLLATAGPEGEAEEAQGEINEARLWLARQGFTVDKDRSLVRDLMAAFAAFAASSQGEAQGQGESLPGPDYIEDGVEVWEAGRFTVRRDATSTISDPAVTLSGNLRPDVADPRALGLALLAAAPRAVAPVDQGHVALADQWRLDADNLRNAELPKASLLTIAEHLDQAARIVGGDRL